MNSCFIFMNSNLLTKPNEKNVNKNKLLEVNLALNKKKMKFIKNETNALNTLNSTFFRFFFLIYIDLKLNFILKA